jgi:hypothetical protein
MRQGWLDGSILAGGVHGLEDDQQRIGVLGVEDVLILGQFDDIFFQLLLGGLLVLEIGGKTRIVILPREIFWPGGAIMRFSRSSSSESSEIWTVILRSGSRVVFFMGESRADKAGSEVPVVKAGVR